MAEKKRMSVETLEEIMEDATDGVVTIHGDGTITVESDKTTELIRDLRAQLAAREAEIEKVAKGIRRLHRNVEVVTRYGEKVYICHSCRETWPCRNIELLTPTPPKANEDDEVSQ